MSHIDQQMIKQAEIKSYEQKVLKIKHFRSNPNSAVENESILESHCSASATELSD